MHGAILAGAVYFAIVFALGFVLGTLRVLVIAPLLGPVGAVMLEVPVILAASWLACGWTLRKVTVAPAMPDRLAMGVTAFALLIAAEFAVSTVVFGRSPADFWASYAAADALLGLAAQIAFAAFPLLRR
jgi:hypothetical protein